MHQYTYYICVWHTHIMYLLVQAFPLQTPIPHISTKWKQRGEMLLSVAKPDLKDWVPAMEYLIDISFLLPARIRCIRIQRR